MFKSKQSLLFMLLLMVTLLSTQAVWANEMVNKKKIESTVTLETFSKEQAWRMFNGASLNTSVILTGTGCTAFDNQPVDQEVCLDAVAQFSVQIGDDFPETVFYEWSMSTDNSTYQSLIGESGFTGADTEQLTIQNVAGLDGNYFRVQVTGADCEGDGISDSAQLAVTTVAIQNQVTNVSCPVGTDGMISASASGGEAPYSYTLMDQQNTMLSNNAPPYSNLSAGTYIIEVIDNNGCKGLVTVDVGTTPDDTPPSFTCATTIPEIVLSASTGEVTVNAVDFVTNVTDECGDVTIKFQDGSGSKTFDCTQTGMQSLNIVLTDDYNNSSTCNRSIEIVDNDAPSVTCSTDVIEITLDNTTTSVTITAAEFIDASSDNCEVTSVLFSDGTAQKVFDCSATGTTVNLTVVVSDAAGNATNCTRTVSISDGGNPTISCGSGLVQVYLNEVTGMATLTAASLATATDICDGTLSVSFVGGDTEKIYSCADVNQFVTLNLIATDAAGNAATCSRSALIIDRTPPMVNCSSVPVAIQFDNGQPVILNAADLVDPTDNCAISSIKFSDGRTTKTFRCDNTNDGDLIEIVVRDKSGNTASCMRTIDVIDNSAPTLICNDDELFVVLLDDNGERTIYPNDLIDLTDECAITSVEYSDGDTEKYFNCNSSNLDQFIVFTVIVRDNGEEIGRCTRLVLVVNTCD